MRHLKYLFIVSLMFLTANCFKTSINAQPANNAEGEVVLLSKAEFLEKVFNYEKQSKEWIYEGTKPCIIDFYADWCGPCRLIAPIMKELAAEYKDDVIFYKIDVDVETELAAVFGVNSIPMILFIPVEGQPRAALGALPKAKIVEQINVILSGKEI